MPKEFIRWLDLLLHESHNSQTQSRTYNFTINVRSTNEEAIQVVNVNIKLAGIQILGFCQWQTLQSSTKKNKITDISITNYFREL